MKSNQLRTLSAIIIDDELTACQVLNSMIDQYCLAIEDVHITQNPEEGIEMVNRIQPDILFLDIEMPKLSGFDVLSKINDFRGKIVFTTAYQQFAIRAFEYNAFDYLLKPIHIERLEKLVARVEENNAIPFDNSNIQQLIHQFSNRIEYPQSIAIHDKGGLVFIRVDEILYLEGQGNYTLLQDEKKQYLVCKTIKDFESILNPSVFLRLHKSYMVNVNKLVRYSPNDGGYVSLSNEKTIPVSRRKRQLLEQFSV